MLGTQPKKEEEAREAIEAQSLLWIESRIADIVSISERWNNNLKITRAMVATIDDRLARLKELEQSYKEEHPEEASESQRRRRQIEGY